MALNPVERRMIELREHWDAFVAQPAKRLLIWQAPDNAGRLLQCFFEAQKHELPYTTGDFFMVFDVPFSNAIQFSRELKEALAGQYEASRGDFRAQGVEPDWVFSAADEPDSASGFIRSLRSFGSKHHKKIGHLVAVLAPPAVANEAGYASWLTRALGEAMPERMRLVVVDSAESPRLKSLAESGHESVFVDALNIDTLNVAQETFAQEATSGPAGVFRNHLMGLVTLVEKGSADQVKVKAADAFAFARKHQWADQEVVVRMLVAGALLKEKRIDESVKIYLGARESAAQAAAAGHPAGQQLVLQTWLGEAGAHLAGGDVAQAARCYDEAAITAQKIPNPILAIESFRMGAFCHARMEHPEDAIARASSAFKVGEDLKPEARVMTTLPLVAVDLLRAVEPGRVASMEQIKYELDADIEKSVALTEQRAAELEKTGNAEQLRAAEADLAGETGRARRNAAQQVEALVAAAGEPFRQWFGRARSLLGSEWPLGLSAALPQAPKDAEAKPEGVATS